MYTVLTSNGTTLLIFSCTTLRSAEVFAKLMRYESENVNVTCSFISLATTPSGLPESSDDFGLVR